VFFLNRLLCYGVVKQTILRLKWFLSALVGVLNQKKGKTQSVFFGVKISRGKTAKKLCIQWLFFWFLGLWGENAFFEHTCFVLKSFPR